MVDFGGGQLLVSKQSKFPRTQKGLLGLFGDEVHRFAM